MTPRFHAISASFHVTPATTAVAAFIDEQAGAFGGGTLTNPPQAIARKQVRRIGEDRKKNLR
jgi:hypothetical protein